MEHSKVVTPDLQGYWCEENTIYVGEGTDQPAATIRIEYLDSYFANGIVSEALQSALSYLAAALCDEFNELEKRKV